MRMMRIGLCRSRAIGENNSGTPRDPDGKNQRFEEGLARAESCQNLVRKLAGAFEKGLNLLKKEHLDCLQFVHNGIMMAVSPAKGRLCHKTVTSPRPKLSLTPRRSPPRHRPSTMQATAPRKP